MPVLLPILLQPYVSVGVWVLRVRWEGPDTAPNATDGFERVIERLERGAKVHESAISTDVEAVRCAPMASPTSTGERSGVHCTTESSSR